MIQSGQVVAIINSKQEPTIETDNFDKYKNLI